MRRGIVSGLLLSIGALTVAVAALQAPQQARAPLGDIVKVRDNLYVIPGTLPGPTFNGGATGVFVAESGVVVVDTKLAGYGQMILDKIKTVTNKPVTTIINTHTHGDHTGSNDGFPATVEIITHENTKTNMAKMDAFKGDKAQFLPKRTYKDRVSLLSGKDRIDLYYFGPGHTNGDTFIVFPALRVLQAGDMFAWKDAPFLDRNNGGTGVEHPKTLAKLIAAVKNVDTVIPGHIPVTKWQDLVEYQQYSADLLAAVETAFKEGKSADAAVASIDLSAKYPGYKSERLKAAVEAIYADLKK
jgi:cyclase